MLLKSDYGKCFGLAVKVIPFTGTKLPLEQHLRIFVTRLPRIKTVKH
jgi:hypothetical protein